MEYKKTCEENLNLELKVVAWQWPNCFIRINHKAIWYQKMSGGGNRFNLVKQKTEVVSYTKRGLFSSFNFLTSFTEGRRIISYLPEVIDGISFWASFGSENMQDLSIQLMHKNWRSLFYITNGTQ